jgi:hypothetical protein
MRIFCHGPAGAPDACLDAAKEATFTPLTINDEQ